MQQPNADRRSFLFTTLEAGGVVAPVLAVARKLLARGHRVRVMSDAASRGEVEAAGAAFVSWTRAPSRPDRSRETDYIRDWDVASPTDGLLRNVDTLMCGPAPQYAEDLIEEIWREPAHLVVGLDLQPGVFAGCEALRQACALLAQQLSLFPVSGIPPLGPGLAPARTDADRALHAEASEELTRLFDHGLPALNDARTALGLPPLAHVADQFRVARRRLLGTARAFDFAPERLPDDMRYVGPQIGPVAWAAPWRSPFPADDARPLVAVAFSTTFQNHAGVLQRVIDAAAALPVRLLVTLAGVIDRAEFSPAANTRLVDSAPHDALFAEAAAVVTHGGHGTVMRALIARRPMLVIPHGRDQNDNAARVAERDAGLVLSADASVEALSGALAALLGEPRYRAGAERLGAAVAEEAARSPVVEELEALAAPKAAARGRPFRERRNRESEAATL